MLLNVFLCLAIDTTAKDRMRELIGKHDAVPPQIFNGDIYCGVRGTTGAETRNWTTLAVHH